MIQAIIGVLIITAAVAFLIAIVGKILFGNGAS
jgi:hypothetical protein